VQAGKQEHQAERGERDALEDAQRARFEVRAELQEDGVADQQYAGGEAREALGPERPAEGVGGHVFKIRKKRSPGTWPGLLVSRKPAWAGPAGVAYSAAACGRSTSST